MTVRSTRSPRSIFFMCHLLMKPQTLFNDKGKYPTLTRMSYCQCRLPTVFTSVFERFGWAHVALLLDKSDLFSLTVGKSLEWGLRKKGFLKAVRELDGNERESCEALLQDVSMYARVVILSVRGPLVREFLLAAHSLGMTRGDWAFLDVEIFQGGYWGETGWAAGDEHDAAARAAYEALLRVSLKLPTGDKFDDFADKVKARAKDHYNYSFSDGEEAMESKQKQTSSTIFALDEAITRLFSQRTRDNTMLKLLMDAARIVCDCQYKESLTRRGFILSGVKKEMKEQMKDTKIDKFLFGKNLSETLKAAKAIQKTSSGTLSLPRRRRRLQRIPQVSTLFSHRQARIDAELNNMAWRVRPEEVLVEVGTGLGASPALHSINEVLKLSLGWSARSSSGTVSGVGSTPSLTLSSFTVGLYKGNRVAVKKIHRKKLDLNKKLLWEIKQARNVSHENTARFIGACVDCPLVFVLTEYCPKGSLKDVLANEELQLDWNFRTSLVHDIVQGMCYLHGGLGAHGKLRSSNCLIDGRFVLKISDYGLHTLCTPTDLIKDDTYYYKLLWTSPELVPGSIYPGAVASLKGDVYSFGIILEEIVVRAGPFHHFTSTMSNEEIVSRVCARETPPFRPVVGVNEVGAGTGGAGAGAAGELLELAAKCWAECPDDRPTFDTINANYIKGYCDNLMDDLLRRMEQYANNLESLVEEKTEQLSLEKRRSEELLYQVLPRPVAQQLMAGEMVQPESFECVTVYFSDIVGFTELCAASTPMQVVDLLNDLYSTFDRIIGFYDVYKVETIGDAYMVVSGLPQRNGDQHAREICLMALAVVEAVRSFVVRHRPTHRLEVRVGVHSGPVCAGVVGVKMPHYCLFGDTVNTASRMESSGQPLRIHLSESTRVLLQQWGTFAVERRGEVELKGRGRMLTHWLLHCSETEAVLSQGPVPSQQYPILFPALPQAMSIHAPYLVVETPTLAA
ncbi:atrial natriuretic peptide receptor 1-like [Hyposmocoma kahamanoa]|uniref:atrial natriuretic peptide receptor 1-like n=1 Tax=Hyposmocoma kahamanoa TaxID=1477025 RepID=UPI000E6D5AF3|nr:atrial natriuretic peptide receptor 1-like [Hyposmocoma kahamanoa]